MQCSQKIGNVVIHWYYLCLFTLTSGSDVAESKLPSPWGDREQRHRTGHAVFISEDWKSTGDQNGPKWKCNNLLIINDNNTYLFMNTNVMLDYSVYCITLPGLEIVPSLEGFSHITLDFWGFDVSSKAFHCTPVNLVPYLSCFSPFICLHVLFFVCWYIVDEHRVSCKG